MRKGKKTPGSRTRSSSGSASNSGRGKKSSGKPSSRAGQDDDSRRRRKSSDTPARGNRSAGKSRFADDRSSGNDERTPRKSSYKSSSSESYRGKSPFKRSRFAEDRNSGSEERGGRSSSKSSGFKRTNDSREDNSFGPRGGKYGNKDRKSPSKRSRYSNETGSGRGDESASRKSSYKSSGGSKGSFEQRSSKRSDGGKPGFKKSRFADDRNTSGNERARKSGKSFGNKFGDNERPPRKNRPRTSGKHVEQPHSEEAPVQTGQIRLNRYIASSGVCSRREADELISMGLVSVNGKTITELGYKVNPGDQVRHEGKLLKAEKPVYILLNKPKGFLTTTSDPQERHTVMHLIGDKIRERIYPVGRLDRNTTGLLLLTNDGDLADKLMHPSYNVKKIYKVELDRALTRSDMERIIDGVQLEEGKAQVDDIAVVSDDGKTIGIELHIGWNRVVRRIFETLGYEVMKLDRSVYAGLDKKDLPRGEWRFLKKEEIIRLKHYK